MSAKIAKQMISRVDEMVTRASSATQQADLPTNKRKAAKRALLQAPSKRKRADISNAAAKASRSVSKHARNKSGRKPAGLLEQARRELRGASRMAHNVSLLSYTSRGGSQTGAVEVRGRSAGVASKSRKAVEHLLQLDAKKRLGK